MSCRVNMIEQAVDCAYHRLGQRWAGACRGEGQTEIRETGGPKEGIACGVI